MEDEKYNIIHIDMYASEDNIERLTLYIIQSGCYITRIQDDFINGIPHRIVSFYCSRPSVDMDEIIDFLDRVSDDYEVSVEYSNFRTTNMGISHLFGDEVVLEDTHMNTNVFKPMRRRSSPF